MALDRAPPSLNPGLAPALAMKGELWLLRSQGRPALPMRRQQSGKR